MPDMSKDIGLIVGGAVEMVWISSTIEAVIPTLPEGEHDLVEFDPGEVRCGMLFDGDVLSEPPAPTPPPGAVNRAVIVERLAAAGKSGAFQTALVASPAFMLSWITPGVAILADDADLAAVLTTAGADVAAITAP